MTGHDARGHILVASLMPQDASTTLFFAALADRRPLRIAEFPGDIAWPLSGASAVIFVRGLFECRDAIGCARGLGIPRYYFLDDNFIAIRDEPETYGRFYDRYTDDGVRAMLRGFAGVLLATEELIRYFADHRLHDRLLLFPPVAGPIPPVRSRQPGQPVTLGFFGGGHRREPFAQYVYPAVVRLARQTPIRVVAAGLERGSLPAAPDVEIVNAPYEPSYPLALQRLAEQHIDVLVHPGTASANNPYKNRHVLINAHALGAAAVFSRTPPYDAIAQAGVALVCDNSEDAWLDALQQVVLDEARRDDLRTRLDAYCAIHFSGDTNVRIIDDMLRAHPAPGAPARVARWAAGMPCLALGRALRVAKRQFNPA